MNHPPLLQSLYVVMLLAIANLGLKGGAFGSMPQGGLVAVAVALVGTGVVLAQVVTTSKAAPPDEAPSAAADDDFDLSA